MSAEAIQTYRDWKVVFARYGEFFEVRPVEVGRSDGKWVEVVHGINSGEAVVGSRALGAVATVGSAIAQRVRPVRMSTLATD